MSVPRRLSRELPSHVGEDVRVAGHLQDYRALGGVSFALVRDRAGLLQLTLKKGASPEAMFELFQGLPRESVVQAEGKVLANPRAKVGAEVLPTKVDVLSRAAVPLPLGVVDKVGADLDTRLNHRVLDLRKPENQAIAELRGALLWALRETFTELGFTEVETPKLLRQGAEGGATMFKVDYFGARAYLAQSPQLYKQMLMATDLERVFEIAPAFRAEPSDTVRHITEFTSIDAEMAYLEGPQDLWNTVEELIAGTFRRTKARLEARGSALASKVPEVRRPFPRVSFREGAELLGREKGTAAFEADMGSEDE
ncbi:MAG: aspartate--tRNA(Asn) ligase, partial [Thermoplasmata archaeon]|nr:aspartate--tRNA(Asn) ligase [Thermoplasmata archaeon]